MVTKAELDEMVIHKDAEIASLQAQIEQLNAEHEKEIKRLYSPGAIGYEKTREEIKILSKEIAANAKKMKTITDLKLPDEPDKRVLLVHYSNMNSQLKERIKQLESKITEV